MRQVLPPLFRLGIPLSLALILSAPSAARPLIDGADTSQGAVQDVYVPARDTKPNANIVFDTAEGAAPSAAAAAGDAGEEPGLLRSPGDALSDAAEKVKDFLSGAVRRVGEFLSGLFEKMAGRNGDGLSDRETVTAVDGADVPETQAFADAVPLLYSDDGKTRTQARDILIAIGDTKVVAPLEEEIAVRRAAGEDVSVLEGTLDEMRERIALREQVMDTWGVKITDSKEDRFSTNQLRIVPRVLGAFTQPNDVKEIKADRLCGASGTYLSGVITMNSDFSGINFTRILIHEFAHAVDHEVYGFDGFKTLHEESRVREAGGPDDPPRYIDFAGSYGAENRREDFATMFEVYGESTKTSFLDTIAYAEQGYPMTLTKLVRIMDVVSAGKDTTTFYQIHGGSHRYDQGYVESMEVPVTRDASGRIDTIDGVSVYRADGSFDLEGLQEYFTELGFAEEFRRENPFRALLQNR